MAFLCRGYQAYRVHTITHAAPQCHAQLTTTHTFQSVHPADARPIYAQPNYRISDLHAAELPPKPSASRIAAGDLPRNLRDSSKLYVTKPAERNMARRYASSALVLACFFASILTGKCIVCRLHRVPSLAACNSEFQRMSCELWWHYS